MEQFEIVSGIEVRGEGGRVASFLAVLLAFSKQGTERKGGGVG